MLNEDHTGGGMFNNLIVRLSKSSLFLAVFLLFCGKSAFATPVTYTYSGATCTPACSISGSFTLSAALGDNFAGFINPSSFSFTDGSLTISSADALTINSFFVTTNASGTITGWNIILEVSPTDFIDASCCAGGFAVTVSQNGGSFAALSGNPGVWSQSSSTSTAPEPSSLFLLGTGLLGLGPFVRRAVVTS
jgi:hypothetical protein